MEEQGGADEKAPHVRAGIVKDVGAPLGVLAHAGVGVLVQGGAVETAQAVLVLGEVGGHPVDDDADAGVVEDIHEGHEVLGDAVAAGGGEVARYLVAPAALEGVLRDGQQLHMGVAHLPAVLRQGGGNDLVIGEDLILLLAPGAQVHLIDVHGTGAQVGLLPFAHPGFVRPGVAGDVPDLGAGGGARLRVEGEGVRLQHGAAVRAGDGVFVNGAVFQALDLRAPDPVDVPLHGGGAGGPAVEIPHHGHGPGVGRPDPEGVPIAPQSVAAQRIVGGVAAVVQNTHFRFPLFVRMVTQVLHVYHNTSRGIFQYLTGGKKSIKINL